MKIIFDSEEQMDRFMDVLASSNSCPRYMGFSDYALQNLSCLEYRCDDCWKNCGVEVEVKEDANENNI